MRTPYVTFFGDGEQTFQLTPALIAELEAKCGPIGALFNRLNYRQFSQVDLSETIRLALIGGGTAPKRAAELIATYVADRPISETYPIAAKILERVWFGAPNEATNG
ncbi:gene transfer agent family protein [Bradyrhizobium sp. CCBAU 51753]|uniref:gene transfer agent family protein n=1 Tax=Bradyrhizobium sp. CCBAU 51753 TaxID=1325100 RepID=UPI00188CA114|nr:gene transfer agent family protein [Bradyrhizobium sp. CCBAU 51753]QOZ26174.1 gene transfer agent family protein [Bradyrhizobium sp. CCBAU 51753]